MIDIFYIGGSPCSGKSTVAEMIANKFDLYYFKVDELLVDYIAKAKNKGKIFSSKSTRMTVDETWLRNPMEQCEEELAIYREIYEFIAEDISNIHTPNGIIAEGAAFIPELMKQSGVDNQHYICITPTKEFQYFHYKQRSWVPYILGGCSNKELAFENWMERDVLFALAVSSSAENLGYKTYMTSDTHDIAHLYEQVCKAFGLSIIH